MGKYSIPFQLTLVSCWNSPNSPTHHEFFGRPKTRSILLLPGSTEAAEAGRDVHRKHDLSFKKKSRETLFFQKYPWKGAEPVSCSCVQELLRVFRERVFLMRMEMICDDRLFDLLLEANLLFHISCSCCKSKEKPSNIWRKKCYRLPKGRARDGCPRPRGNWEHWGFLRTLRDNIGNNREDWGHPHPHLLLVSSW